VCVWMAAIAAAQTPADKLFQAIRNDDLASLKAQLAAGADVNTKDRRGASLLLYAAAYGSPESVKLLLDSGADVDAANAFDVTPLIWAGGEPAKVRMLVAKGANVNRKTKKGRTPLMIAAACDGCVDTVALLLERGADVKAKDEVGVAALDMAAIAGGPESVQLLLARGGDARGGIVFGLTPLMGALVNCDQKSATALLAAGADVNAANTDGGTVKFGKIQLVNLTPLMISAPFCSAAVVRTLLDAGAKINARDIRGMTPLMLAVGSEHQDPAVVKLLLKAGADVNVKSTAGETALDWARKYGNREVIAQLTEAGAKAGVVAPAPAGQPAPVKAPEAVERAAGRLERTAVEFFHQSGCVGCHHQSMAAFALTGARGKIPPELIQMMESEWKGAQETMLQRLDGGGAPDGESYALMALAQAHYPPNALTDTVAVHIASMQRRAGNWHVGDASRSPIQESDIARTARCLRGLQVYGPPGRKADFDRRIAAARNWLAAAKAYTNDDRAMQLAGLAWAGAEQRRVSALGRELVAAQRGDGGWAQNPHLESDAYATGEALWALRESGVLKPEDAAYRRGVGYLLSTQMQDGSWYVRSRAPKFQPYFQSGFPYEHDQWVSSAATAWAVAGLAAR